MFLNVYKGKRVFVTGCTGFKGSWLCYWLKLMGAEVAGYAVDIPTQPSLFEILDLEDKIKYYQNDIRNVEDLAKAIEEFQPEFIFHLAAMALVKPSFEMPKDTFDTNLGGTVNVLECIKKTKSIKVAVMITSDKCYYNQDQPWGYRENDILGGKEPYGASKACAEIAIHAYYHSYFKSSSAPAVVSVRAGNVIGGGDWAEARIVPDAVRAWSCNRSLIVRHPNFTRPWQLVLEPLSGYLWVGAQLFCGNTALTGEGFNFGPDTLENYSVKELLDEIAAICPGFVWDQDKAVPIVKEDRLLKLDLSKTWQKLLWRPTLTFKETVQATATWYLHYYHGSGEKSLSEVTEDYIRAYEDLAKQRNIAWAVDSNIN